MRVYPFSIVDPLQRYSPSEDEIPKVEDIRLITKKD